MAGQRRTAPAYVFLAIDEARSVSGQPLGKASRVKNGVTGSALPQLQ